MSLAVIYDTSSPWTPPRSPPAPSIEPYNCIFQLQASEQENKRPQWGYPTSEFLPGVSDHTRSYSVSPFLPHHPGVNGIGSPQSMLTMNSSIGMYSSTLGGHVHHRNGTGGSVDRAFATHQNGSLATAPGQDSRVQSVSSSQLAGNSRSARMRRALSIPTRGGSTPATTSQTLPMSDTLSSLPLLQSKQFEVIAEFGPRDQAVPYPFSTPRVSYDSAGKPTSFVSAPLPPRLQTTSPPLGKSRFKSRRPADEDLPPRFRSSPSAPRVVAPPPSLRNQHPAPSNRFAPSSHPQISQSQHLSTFLSSSVQHAYGIPNDSRTIQQPDLKPLNLPSKARALAPIGAERAQRLASTANVMPSNNSINSYNLNPTYVGPPPGLSKPLSFPSNLVAHESYPQLFQGLHPNIPATSSPSIGSAKEALTELEKLFRRTKMNQYAPKIFSPLSPLRNPDSWAPSDGKWRREEREQRRQRTLYSCETSVFRRRISDQRSRIECEEFVYGLEVSEHCFWCRQDTLCKLLLVHRARESIRSNSSSPLSDYSTSSDEGVSDDEPMLDTSLDSTLRPSVDSTSDKLLEFRVIEVVDNDEECFAPDSPPSAALRTRASPALIHIDI